jgi:alkylation response protein AidB-like acyl-CoA dehydrogenase
MSGEHDKMLADLYEEWQAGCRAAAGALQRTLYPNEEIAMPRLPNDDEEHQACRQMAAVLIERTVYDEFTAQRWFHAAAENIQIHGGIGFTWEHPAHLYFKRAKSSELLFGDPTYHRELLAQRIGI